jgi:hypothetical protein
VEIVWELAPREIAALLWMCSTMAWSVRVHRFQATNWEGGCCSRMWIASARAVAVKVREHCLVLFVVTVMATFRFRASISRSAKWLGIDWLNYGSELAIVLRKH